MTMLDGILDKKLILISGKGGIGKSLTAATIAQHAVSAGRKVCLVESNPQEQITPLFGHEKIGHSLTEIKPNLFAINLNPQENFRDFVVLHLGFAKLFDRVFTKPLVKSFINMLPGIAELTLLGRLFYFCELDESHKFDLVIFDGFASGHFLSLLKTPDAVLNSGMVGPIIKETQRVKDFVFNKDLVSVLMVTMPEPLIISEAVDFCKNFKQDLPVPHSHVIVNRFLDLSPEEKVALSELAIDEPAVKYLQDRLVRQEQSLRSLKDGLKDLYREGETPSLFMLPDLGAVNEPLSDNFAQSWFSQVREDFL